MLAVITHYQHRPEQSSLTTHSRCHAPGNKLGRVSHLPPDIASPWKLTGGAGSVTRPMRDNPVSRIAFWSLGEKQVSQTGGCKNAALRCQRHVNVISVDHSVKLMGNTPCPVASGH